MSERSTIAITLGDPAGIGPEITWKALADEKTRSLARWIILGEEWLAKELDSRYSKLPRVTVSALQDIPSDFEILLFDRQSISRDKVAIGEISAACGAASIDYVKTATQLCLAGTAQALVTGPLSKEAVALSGFPEFTGHTEYLADLCGVADSRMLLYHEKIKTIHVTTHVSLLEATRISQQRVAKTIRLGYQAMTSLGCDKPEIAVCGLNPHAGENGMFGREEIETIIPAIEEVRAEGINALGPFPADALFVQATRGRYDLIVAMYHDQGCIPMKVHDFENTVNVTLGLPIIRTSVDHGTAFDIAGQGIADPHDMKVSMKLAVRLAQANEATLT